MHVADTGSSQSAAACLLGGETALLVAFTLRATEQSLTPAVLAGCVGGLVSYGLLGNQAAKGMARTAGIAVFGAAVIVYMLLSAGAVVLVWPLALAATVWIGAAAASALGQQRDPARRTSWASVAMLAVGVGVGGWLLAVWPAMSYESMTPVFVAVPPIAALVVMVESTAFASQ